MHRNTYIREYIDTNTWKTHRRQTLVESRSNIPVTQSTRPKKKKEYARFTKGGDDVEIPETDEAAKKEEIARERGGGGGGGGWVLVW